MREIKFRAWDKEEKEMVSVSGIGWHGDGEVADINTGGSYHIPIDRYELMQFTGLRDKSGKEIYEGDIVHYDATFAGSASVIFRTTVVQYRPPEFLPHHLSNCSGYGVKIIGNIHENPELVNGEKS